MTKQALNRRIEMLEDKVGINKDNGEMLKQCIKFLESFMPDGACWNLEAEAQLLISQGFTFKGLMDSVAASYEPGTLPNQGPMHETPMEPPSQWGKIGKTD